MYYWEFDDDDWAYFRKVFTQNWKVLVEGIYYSIVAYLKGEECDPVLAAKAAAAVEQKALLEREQAYAQKQAKKIGKKHTLKKRIIKSARINNSAFNLNTIDTYNSSNESYAPPTVKNVTLKSKMNMTNTALPHEIRIAVRNADAKVTLETGGIGPIIKEADIFKKIDLPVMNLVSKGILCTGIGYEFVKKSIRATGHTGADIIVVLYDISAAENGAAKVVGVATLYLKMCSLEVDLICSQILYKMAGSILMNKIIEIARILGKKDIELMSVYASQTVRFYTRKFGFKRVKASDAYAIEATRKGLLPLRRQVTQKKAAGGAGAKCETDSN